MPRYELRVRVSGTERYIVNAGSVEEVEQLFNDGKLTGPVAPVDIDDAEIIDVGMAS